MTLQAQIELVPPTTNPILQNEARLKTEARAKIIDNFNKRYHLATYRNEILEGTVPIVSGQSKTICYDTTLITGSGSSFSLLNCDPIDFGTVTLDSTCFTYASNPGLLTERDTVCIEFCRNAMACDTIIYPILIKRANGVVNVPIVQLDAEDTYTYCADADTMNLPGNFASANILSETICGEYSDFGTTITQSGLCFLYEASTSSESDEICYLVCDEASVCDTIKIEFSVSQDTIGLPFFDDFTYTGPYPNRDKWLSNDVFVNNTFGNNAPSVGVATFDGLDAGGSPHGGGNGISDILTSAYINLSGVNEAYLTYYIQAKGNGDAPEIADSLILEFKNSIGEWIFIDNFSGLASSVSNDSIPPFSYQTNLITDPNFLFNGFQFRFKNISSNSGVVDLWNLDYVNLDQGSPNSTPDDMTFSDAPTTLLKDYTSMPWKHFEGFANQELDTEITATAKNISAGEITISDSDCTYNELVTNANNVYNFTIFDVANNDHIFAADETRTVNRAIPQVNTLASNMEAQFAGADSLIFETEYSLVPSVQQQNIHRSNDTVRRQTIFDNYFSYDDGSAESNLAAKGSGTQVAVKFHANVADELQAIQLYIPHVNVNVTNQFFNLKVWADLDDDPIYLAELLRPVYVDTHFDSLQGFTTYRLQDYLTGELTPIQIPAGDFYIGWEQVSNEFDNAIPVGYDRNSPDAAQYISINQGQGWIDFPPFILQGALMLRPVFGDRIPPLTDVENVERLDNQVNIYPNPSTGKIFINIENDNYVDYEVTVFTATGQLVYQNQLTRELDFEQQLDGVYFVKITNFVTQQSINKKVIIIK